jgi:hypothetical protein
MTTFTRSVFHTYKIAVAAAVMAASPAFAAENWLACDGTVATSTKKDGQTQSTSAPAKDTYVVNDTSKMLFKYSETRKMLDPIFVTGFDDKKISWANAGGASAGTTAATWQGSLDRASLALKMTRTERDETMTWEQQCKATSPKTK